MYYREAILSRVSRRKYIKRLPDIEHIKMINDVIEDINRRQNLKIQLIIDDPEGFSGRKSYGFFTGVRNYIALVGPKKDINIHEKLGFFGEQLLLTCETLGYSTCWVGGTFDREKCRCKVDETDVFMCVIVFGFSKKRLSPKEKLLGGTIHMLKKKKKIEDLFYSEEQPPNWFIEGMRMVQRAPSAMNRQPVIFYYTDGMASAKVKDPELINYYDLGIAKYHFICGTEGGKWEFGNGGVFVRK